MAKRIQLQMMLAAVVVFLAVTVFAKPQIAEAAFRAKGIDVSRWQGKIEWEKVKEDGIEFVMVGVGRYKRGNVYVDPQLKNNLANANAQGIHVGVYLYSEAVTEEEAREEADFVLDQIDGYKISYPIAFDIEDTVHLKLTTKERTDITIAFLEVIQEAGYYPMIYASENWFNTNMDLNRLTKYDKWVARWADSVNFSPYTMWQYSATGKVSGISGDVDLDYCYVDYSKVITPRLTALSRRDKTGWKTDGTRYWYIREDGSQPVGCLETIDGKTYYFNKKGYRFSGWKKLNGKYYYFRKNGTMKNGGWLKIKTKRYYLDPATGERMSGWLTLDGKQYYLSKKGVMQTGWKKLKGKYYYFDQDGIMQKGLIEVEGEKYYLSKKTGKRLTGWRKLSGKWYYFGPKTGMMQKSCNVGRFKLDENGVCINRETALNNTLNVTGSLTQTATGTDNSSDLAADSAAAEDKDKAEENTDAEDSVTQIA